MGGRTRIRRAVAACVGAALLLLTCAAPVGATGALANPRHDVTLSPPALAATSATSISAGGSHSCAIVAGGTVYCWGANGAGQLGDGSNADRIAPVPVSGLSGVTAISAGSYHTCALTAGGTVMCWGRNSEGQLGGGSPTSSSTPVAVAGLSGVTAISAGAYHTCALTQGGTVACWGNDANGELGDGTTTSRGTPAAVSGLAGAVAISAGGYHTCALLADRTVTCWGSNSNGQLGDGSITDRHTPVAVSGLTDAVAVSAGGHHTCAVLTGGTAMCWGLNGDLQLGDRTGTDRHTPVAVSGLAGAVAISAGDGHTCAVLTGGTAMCWGLGDYGQLGHDLGGWDSSVPVAVTGLTGAVAIAAGSYHTCAILSSGPAKCWGWGGHGQLGDGQYHEAKTPIAVAGLSGAVAIDAGFHHTCALRSGGTVMCWGDNGDDELGDGSTEANSPNPVALSGISGAVAISAGIYHTCAVITGGTVKCWGDNESGQLGDGSTDNSPTPVAVSGLAGAVAVSAAGDHTCAIVTGGTVSCWGANDHGQLGDGGTENSLAPVAVSGLTGVTAITSGDNYTCALLSGGTVVCWGANSSGQLGDGSTTSSSAPVAVSGLSGVTGIDAFEQHTCALLSGGTIKCWGANLYGELGDGSTTARHTPVAVSGLAGAVAISAGGWFTCALLSGGTAKCWGGNGGGQFGDGSTTESLTPVAVSGLTGAVAIGTGYMHTCALLSDGTGRCWGDNSSGQLGIGALPSSTTPVTVIFPVLTVPGAPTGVTAVPGNAQATVSWTAPASDGGSAITSYTITSTPGSKTCHPTPATGTTCTVTGLANGTPTTFTVAARNGIGTGPASDPSDPVTPRTTPGAPTGVTAVAGTLRATVSWTAPVSNGGSAITGYTVTSSPGSKTCTPTPATGATCVVTDLGNGIPYSFTVTASNVAGTGTASTASAPLALAPTIVTCTPGTPGGSAATVAGSTVACLATPGSGAAFTGWTASGLTPATSGSAAQSFIAGSPGAGSIVAAYTDDLGSHGVTFGYTIGAAPTVPGAPTGVTGIPGNGQVDVHWTAPASNGGSPIIGYTVTSTSGGKACSPTPATTTTCAVTGLTNGTPYSFTVTATNGVGTGPASGASAPVTPKAPVVRRPDGRIRLGTGAFVGDNVYNTTGAGQSRTGSAAKGKTITFGISIQNDGSGADRFKVKATGAAASAYTVKYFHGTTDITAAVVAGSYLTPSLAPGATYLITARVTVKSTAAVGSSVTRLVTLTSVGNSVKKDAVKFTGKRA